MHMHVLSPARLQHELMQVQHSNMHIAAADSQWQQMHDI